LDHHYYAIIIVEAIVAGLLERQNNVAAVGESKLSIQSNVAALGKSISLFSLLQFYLLLTCMRFKTSEV
jgi:hypothetical protein